jgi:hypothetical protein
MLWRVLTAAADRRAAKDGVMYVIFEERRGLGHHEQISSWIQAA